MDQMPAKQPEAAPEPVGPGRFALTLKQKQYLWAYAFMLIPLLFFVIIRMAPALYAFRVSLYDWKIISHNQKFTGLANYHQLFTDPIFWKSLKNTLIYVVVGVPSQVLVGLGIALLLHSINRYRGIYRMLYFAPYVTSSVAVAWVWRWMYLPDNGFFNAVLNFVGIHSQGFLGDPSQAIYAIIATIVWQGMGFQMIIFLAGLETIPQVFYEAARIDGASAWQQFKNITIPLLNPTILFAVVIGTIGFLQTFTQVQNMSSQGQGGPLNSTKSLVLFIYQQAFVNFHMGYASAATVILFLIILLITLVQMRVLNRPYQY